MFHLEVIDLAEEDVAVEMGVAGAVATGDAAALARVVVVVVAVVGSDLEHLLDVLVHQGHHVTFDVFSIGLLERMLGRIQYSNTASLLCVFEYE